METMSNIVYIAFVPVPDNRKKSSGFICHNYAYFMQLFKVILKGTLIYF